MSGDLLDFSDNAYRFLKTIGTQYRNRCVDRSESNNIPNSHESTRSWIVETLLDAGYNESSLTEQSFVYNGMTVTNLILTVYGKDLSRQIIAGAHYDGEGVGDNGSGFALLLATACEFTDITPPTTIKFIFFDAEELGLIGSSYYANHMTQDEVQSTLYMINMDCLAFGDYCSMYGGVTLDDGNVVDTEGYEMAIERAKQLGFKTWGTNDLDGYYSVNGKGPEMDDNAVFTNPWTNNNPAPRNGKYLSPSTGLWGDHVAFMMRGIIYIYFEASNWFTEGTDAPDDPLSFTSYYETSHTEWGNHGMFMNTVYDTWENLIDMFPGRTLAHYRIYSPILNSLLIEPAL